MAGLDEYIDNNPLPNEESTTPNENRDTVPVQSETDLSRITIKRETRESVAGVDSERARGDLREEINGSELLEGFSTAEITFLDNVIQQYSPQIQATINDANTKINEAAELSEENLSSSLNNIRLEGDFSGIGQEIDSEAARIRNISNGQEISISLSSESTTAIFESKRDALLYLYYQKISIKCVQDFLSQLDTTNMTEDEVSILLPILKWFLIGTVFTSTSGTIFRKINHFFLKSTGGRLGSGTYISVSSQGSEGSESVGTGEVQKRREAAMLLDYIFEGNNSIGSGGLPDMNVLDHSIPVSGENIGGRLWEGTYWRNLRHLSRGRGALSLGRISDFLIKPILLNSEGGTVKRMLEMVNIKNSVLRSLFQTQQTQVGEQIQFTQVEVLADSSEGKMLTNIRAYVDLSHEIPNSEENVISDRLKKILDDWRNGDLDFLHRFTKADKAIQEIQHRLLEATTGKRGTKADLLRIFGDGTNAHPGEGARLLGMEVRPNEIDMKDYNESITARRINAQLNGETYNEGKVRTQLQSFFASIGSGEGQNRYNFQTASLIIEGILGGEIEENTITRIFNIPVDQVRTSVTRRTYVGDKNAALVEDLKTDLETRAQNIGSIEELNNFERNAMNSMLDDGGKPRTGYGETYRILTGIISRKQAEGLPDIRTVPVTPNPTGTESGTLTPETPEDLLRAQNAFDIDGNMTEDARIILESNLALYVLNGGELGDGRIEQAINDYKAGVSNIGELIDDLSSLNEGNTIKNLTNGQALIIQYRTYSAQDMIERSLISSGNFTENTNIEIDIRNGEIVSTVKESGTIISSFNGDTIGELESQIRVDFAISGDIPDWNNIPDIPTNVSVDTTNYQRYGFLRNIDDFFRKAR